VIEDAEFVSLSSRIAKWEVSYFVRFGYGYAHNGENDEEEAEGEQGEAFRGSCLERLLGTNQTARAGLTHHYTVVPGEDGKLMQSSDQIPPSSDVASDKDTEGQNWERMQH